MLETDSTITGICTEEQSPIAVDLQAKINSFIEDRFISYVKNLSKKNNN